MHDRDLVGGCGTKVREGELTIKISSRMPEILSLSLSVFLECHVDGNGQ